MQAPSFLSRVRALLPELHPAERRLGDFVCDFPGELASFSASELAELAHVSKATVTRFVKRLGYENYEEARRHARAERSTGSRFFLASSTDVSNEQSIDAHIRQGGANLEATLSSITEKQLSALVAALLAARKVWVIGYRSSHSFAAYLQWQLTQVIEQIVALPGAGHTMGEHIVSMVEDDVVIIFGLRRRVSTMDALIEQIIKTGAKVLYITDEGVPFLKRASWHIRCQTLAPGPLFNHVAVMAVCHLIATRAIEQAGVEGRTRLRDIEAFNDLLNEL